MALSAKKNTDKWFPVILLDDTDFKSPETGIAFGSVTVKYHTEGATSQSTYSVTTDDWKEAGNGEYWLRIGASEFTAAGKYEVSVAASGALTFRFAVEVTTWTFEDLFSGYNSIIKLKQLDIENDAGTALRAVSVGGNGHGIHAQGDGTVGHGIFARGDDVAGMGHGIRALGAPGGWGMQISGKVGVSIEASDGNALQCSAGGTGYDGILAQGSGNAGHGIQAQGGGTTGNGILAQGYGTGNGIHAFGGDLGGDGIRAEADGPDVGNGINAIANGNGHGIKATGDGAGHGMSLVKGSTGKDLDADEIGTIFDIDGVTGAGILEVLKKFADDNGGADFDATTDSLEKIAISGGGITAQEVRDAMKLAPSGGAPAVDSIDDKLDGLETDVGGLDTKIDVIDGNVDDIETLLGTVDGKVDTIDSNVDAVLEDTGTTIPATLTTIEGKVDVVDGNVDDIETLLGTVDGKVDALSAALAIVDANVDSIVAKLPSDGIAGVSDTGMKLDDTVDGVTVDTLLQYLMSMANGRFVKSVIDSSTFRLTYYERDNVTPLFAVDVNDTIRARV
jgi:archaellum component FlaC